MNCNQYITKELKVNTLLERDKIEALFKANLSNKAIANIIGVSKRTIIREKKQKKRGIIYGLLNYDLPTRNEYSSEKAHNIYLSIQKKKQGELKIGNDIKLAEFLENQIIKHNCSPYVSLELAKRKDFKVTFSLKTLYNYIYAGIFVKLNILIVKEERKAI